MILMVYNFLKLIFSKVFSNPSNIVIMVLIIGLIVIGIKYKHQVGVSSSLQVENSNMSSKLAESKNTIATQLAAIKQLEALRVLDQQALASLSSDHERISKIDLTNRAKLNELQSKNKTIGVYLNTPIPADLSRLLNNPNCKPKPKTNSTSSIACGM